MIVMSVSVDFFKFMTFRGQRFFKQLRWCWRTKAYSTSCLQTAHLSPAFSPQFSVEMCAASKNCEKFTKTSFWEVQGRSRHPPLYLVAINCGQPTVKISWS